MGFSTALSGLKAAATTLSVTGNNIANSQTTGFKESRSQFGDVYVSSLGSVGKTAIGSGVRVSSVAQQFKQGNIEPTANSLDLALSGEGFFAMGNSVDPLAPEKPLEATFFTRNGAFHLNNAGNVVDDSGRYLLAFKPTGTTVAEGFDVGVKLPLKVNTDQGAPTATTSVDMKLNLNGAAETAITPFAFASGTLPYIPDPTTYTHTTSITTYDSLGNAHIASTYFCKTAVPDQWDMYTFIDGRSVQPGVQADSYAIPPVEATGSIALPAGTITTSPTRVVFDAKGNLSKISAIATTADLAIAAAALSKINSAKADAAVVIGGVALKAAIARETTATTQLAKVTQDAAQAVVDSAASAVKAATSALTAAQKKVSVTDPNDDTIIISGTQFTLDQANAALAAKPTDPSLIGQQLNAENANNAALAKITVAEKILADKTGIKDSIQAVVDANPPAIPDGTVTDTLLIAKALQVDAQTLFDAIGLALPPGTTIPETVMLTSAKEEARSAIAANTAAANNQIAAVAAAVQSTVDAAATETEAANAITADADAVKAAAALGLPGVTRTLNTKIDFGGIDLSSINSAINASPFTFSIDLATSTQFSTPFTVNDLKQNGLSVGNLTGVDVDKLGIVYAKYSNGFAKPLGQVALARFPSNQDLAKVGATTWMSTADSGMPIYGAGGDNNFGTIQSSAIENSNVDLSEQLVKLIVAQQAYQASSQTITTEKSLVDTILRI